MIRKSFPWLMLVVGVSFGLLASNRLIVFAQAQRSPARPTPNELTLPFGQPDGDPRPAAVAESPANPPQAEIRSSTATVHDLLVRPYHFTFSRPTSLLQVCSQLKQTLKVPVVLDIAALGRQDVEPEDTVQLELEGVRLKTGLKLLLDQVGLTYHVVTEDNLLIITDREGSEEPLDRVWSELQAMHREIHDVQDAIDELTEYLAAEKGDGPRMRKPTIIEEMPEEAPQKNEGPRQDPNAPAKKPNAVEGPAAAPRSNSTRVPLVGPGRPL
ncbi:MAG: hypothetical protein ACLQGP_28275 [Isosphaeraceae bacterium]